MIVLITGATSGFGMSCAELFAKKGYKTILIGRRNITKVSIRHIVRQDILININIY